MKVLPTSDVLRKILKHPIGGAFLPEGPADWPDDSFTHRRIRDGDVTVVKQEEPPKVSLSPRKKVDLSGL